MGNNTSYFEAYKKTASYLIDEAGNYSEQNFTKKPSTDEWGLAEMYHHIALVTHKCLDNVDVCKSGKGKAKKYAIGPAIFSLMGSFPPFKMHVHKIPDEVTHIYHPQAMNKADAITALQQTIERMEEYKTIVDSIPKNQRAKHWAGGWFTAMQWYQSAEMHIRHHLRQKKRIDSFLKKLA